MLFRPVFPNHQHHLRRLTAHPSLDRRPPRRDPDRLGPALDPIHRGRHERRVTSRHLDEEIH